MKIESNFRRIAMQIVLLIFSACLFSASPLWASEWIKTFSFGIGTFDPVFRLVQQAPDGGYLAVGTQSVLAPSNGNVLWNGKILKFDTQGNALWQKTYYNDVEWPVYFYSIQKTIDNGYILGGLTGGPGSLVLKIDNNGNIEWQKNIDRTFRATSVIQNSNGEYIASPYAWDKYQPIFKFDSNGNVLWKKEFWLPTGYRDFLTASMKVTSDGKYILTGTMQMDGVNGGGLLLKFDDNGNILWAKNFITPVGGGGTSFLDAQATSDGGCIAVGSNYQAPGMFYGWIVKVDGNGNVLWQKNFSGVSAFYSISQTSDGGYFLISAQPSGQSGISKFDSNWNVQWTKTLTGSNQFTGSAAQTFDGGYILSGRAGSSNAMSPLLLKLNNNGVIFGCPYVNSSSSPILVNADAPVISDLSISVRESTYGLNTYSTVLVSASNLEENELCSSGIDLPQTGQTTSYATGDDGAIQAGVAWPNPRFTDNGDQTITDNLTGLMWTKDAGTPTFGACSGGSKTWQAALDYVACLNTNIYLGHNDWRLPNANELAETFVNAEVPDPATWLTSRGFTNVQSNTFWSSTTCSGNSGDAWITGLGHGIGCGVDGKEYNGFYVLPVRGGQSSVPDLAFLANIWKTGQTVSYDANILQRDDGALQRGITWPSPRFTDNSNGTVTDNLTGLIWLKNSNCFDMQTWYDALSSANALDSGQCGLTDASSAGDWRLPNREELYSLIDFSTHNPALPVGHPFTNVPPYWSYYWYWSSTTYAIITARAWVVGIWDGDVGSSLKSERTTLFWPVRGGIMTTPIDTPPPTTSASPLGGTYTSAQNVILTCNDSGGSGCQTTYYCTGSGCNPTTVYSGAINIGSSTVLRFYSTDIAGNSEADVSIKTETYTITIAPVTHTITASSGANGSISPSGAVSVNHGDSQSFTITPNANYHVADVLVDAVSQGAITSYTFNNVTANHTIIATFALNTATHTITASAGANGSISPLGSPPGSVTVNHNATQTFTVTPDSGYIAVMSGTCGGNLNGNKYTTNPITADCTVIASFNLTGPNQPLLPGDNVQVSVPVPLPSGGTGNVTVTFDQVTTGGTLSITATDTPLGGGPPTGFSFLGTYYEISFTGNFTGDIYITLPYDDSSMPPGRESNLRLFHWESPGWKDVTISLDTVNNTITGRVTSLSPFGTGYSTTGYSTGANTNMIALLALLAISTGVFLIKRNRKINQY